MTPPNEPAPLWRTLEDYRNPPEAAERLDHELPWRTSEEVDGMDRRDFARLMAAALAMAGLSGCTRQPIEKIVPYVRQPNQVTQNEPLFYATSMPFGGDALGLVVKSHMGRPVKVEGNPRHPASLGATSAFAQASLFDLYDPGRSQTLIYQGRISSWVAFVSAIGTMLGERLTNRGAGLRLLTRSVNSPTLGRQIEAFLARFPEARWHQYDPVISGARAGGLIAFGRFVNTWYRVDQAAVILSVDSDFLSCGPGHVRYARDFAARRATRAGDAGMNRLYAVESCPTNTGAAADHRLPLRNRDLEPFLRAVAQGIGVQGLQGAVAIPEQAGRWIPALVKDLQQHRGASLVIAGDNQPPRLHALAHAINAALGNAGKTVVYTDPVEANPAEPFESLRQLVTEMNAGAVDMLVILGGNPVYDAPADLGFENALSKVRNKVHLGLYFDETAARCQWHVPGAHYLEEWSDCRAFDGTASIVQPLIAPLYHGRSAHELLSVLNGQLDVPPYEIVRGSWRANAAGDFDRQWRAWLHDGVIPGSALPERTFPLSGDLTAQLAQPQPSGDGLEIQFRPDPNIWDGRFAHNNYLQELPKPVTTLVWDAAAYVSPATAARLDLEDNDVVELDHRGRRAPFPVLVVPGHADDAFTVHLGYGRRRGGSPAEGFNAYTVRTSDAPWWSAGLEVRKTGSVHRLAVTQGHHGMVGRHPVRSATLEHYTRESDFARKEPYEPSPSPTLNIYPEWRYEGYKWGMAIDLNSCIGCNACVMACDVENNIPVVGRKEVMRGREMHWLRIDSYRQGAPENPRMHHQPVMCMHCETAPCELVCPVNATVHSSEGLNQMVYNRCVGTRYCSNNCPYKVRRFNFFLYSDWYSESLALMRNPDVTVRSRGVMEKCTYCVQRIQSAKIRAEKEDRTVRDGEIVTACQQACPTQAIVFGDLNNKDSRVARMKRQPLDYGLLEELNTKPRTTYLARVVNLNPEIEQELPHA